MSLYNMHKNKQLKNIQNIKIYVIFYNAILIYFMLTFYTEYNTCHCIIIVLIYIKIK
jgi:hypothetical protein